MFTLFCAAPNENISKTEEDPAYMDNFNYCFEGGGLFFVMNFNIWLSCIYWRKTQCLHFSRTIVKRNVKPYNWWWPKQKNVIPSNQAVAFSILSMHKFFRFLIVCKHLIGRIPANGASQFVCYISKIANRAGTMPYLHWNYRVFS